MSRFSVGKYFKQLKCDCGKCDGFGNGRLNYNFTVRVFNKKKNRYEDQTATANERPGIHRGAIWILRAAMFYSSTIETGLHYSFRGINSGYRCVDNNLKHQRPTINHMGMALDLGFSKNGVAMTKYTKDVDKEMDSIRAKIFVPHIGATVGAGRHDNKIWLESSSDGALSWVHFDVRSWKKEYLTDDFFVQSVDDADGGSIVEFAKLKSQSQLVGCPGNC